MAFKVKRLDEKDIEQEGTVDGKSYPLPPALNIGTLPRAKGKKQSSIEESTDSEDSSKIKAKIVLLSKGETWTLKLPKHFKYRVALIQENAGNRTLFQIFAANEYSATKDAFNRVDKTLAPLLEDGCFLLQKPLLKQLVIPDPIPPDKISSRLIEAMQKEPGVHTDWQSIIQKLEEKKKKPSLQRQKSTEESGLASLKRKFQNKKQPAADSKPHHPPLMKSMSEAFKQDIVASGSLVAVTVPKVGLMTLSDEEASQDVWTQFRRGTLRDKSKIMLIEAAEKQYVKSCLKLILSRTVSVNVQHPKTGDTALHIAIRSGNLTLVKLLLAFRADPTVPNVKVETPYDVAKKLNDKNIVDAVEVMKGLQATAKSYYSQNTKVPKKKNSSEKFLLSLDGGGMRSVIMCHILTAIESRMKELDSSSKPLQSYFDYVAGTSAGSIIGGLLLYSDVSVPQAGMYLYKFMVDVFCCPKSERIQKLKGFICDTVGAETVLAESKSGNMIVTTTLANVRPNKLHLMTSYGEPRDDQLGPDKRKVWEALVASAAAPTYFPAFQSFLDGGLMANNPTLSAMTDILMQPRTKSNKRVKIGCVLSLGTGFVDPPQPVENFEVYVPGFTLDFIRNLFQSSMGFFSLLTHFVEQTTQSNGEVVRQAEVWCDSIEASYFRLSPPLKEDIPPDIKSIDKFIALMFETEKYVLEHYSVIDKVSKLILSK